MLLLQPVSGLWICMPGAIHDQDVTGPTSLVSLEIFNLR